MAANAALDLIDGAAEIIETALGIDGDAECEVLGEDGVTNEDPPVADAGAVDGILDGAGGEEEEEEECFAEEEGGFTEALCLGDDDIVGGEEIVGDGNFPRPEECVEIDGVEICLNPDE